MLTFDEILIYTCHWLIGITLCIIRPLLLSLSLSALKLQSLCFSLSNNLPSQVLKHLDSYPPTYLISFAINIRTSLIQVNLKKSRIMRYFLLDFFYHWRVEWYLGPSHFRESHFRESGLQAALVPCALYGISSLPLAEHAWTFQAVVQECCYEEDDVNIKLYSWLLPHLYFLQSD